MADNYLWGDDRVQFYDNGLQNLRTKYEWSWYALKDSKLYKLGFGSFGEASWCKYIANTEFRTTLGSMFDKTITEVSKEGRDFVLYTQDVRRYKKAKRLILKPKKATFDYFSKKCDKYPFKRTKPHPHSNRHTFRQYQNSPVPRLACYQDSLNGFHLHPSYRHVMAGSRN